MLPKKNFLKYQLGDDILTRVAKRGQTCQPYVFYPYLKICNLGERISKQAVEHSTFHFMLQRRTIGNLCPIRGRRNKQKKKEKRGNEIEKMTFV